MCFADGSSPPAFGTPTTAARLDRIVLASPGNTMLAAHAVPDVPTRELGVLVLPDGRGLHAYYEQLAGQLARIGIESLAIDLYGRTAGTGPRGAEFGSGAHSAALTWAGVQDDLAAAVDYLRADGRSVVVVGFCLGGRIALLAATLAQLGLAGAVAFYPQTSGPARSDLPAPDELVGALTCPVLTIFGGADDLIAPEQIEAWRRAGAGAPEAPSVIVYPDAPHSFFDREMSRFQQASEDAACRLVAFLDRVAKRQAAG